MDQVIDGRMDRVGCEEGEEQCDVCRRQESSPRVEQHSQELPLLQEGLDPFNVRFEDSSIGISSQVQGSIPSSASSDQGFMDQLPIPSRFQTSQTQELETMFEQQQ